MVKSKLKSVNKRIMAIVMVLVMGLSGVFVFADDYILRDEVEGIYTGSTAAAALINAARFNDVAPGSALAEVVARNVALGIITTDGPNFRPNDNLTRQEALAFAMRVAGLSGEAVALGTQLAPAQGITNAQAVLALGYRQLAINNGIITAAFPASGMATREEVAFLLFSAINSVEDDIFDDELPLVEVYTFEDWQRITGIYLIGVENIVAHNIMLGDGQNFNPRDHITRGQLAHVLGRLDTVLFELRGWERRHGTIARVHDTQTTLTGEAFLDRDIHVRRGDGSVDIIRYHIVANPSPQVQNLDAVVFRNGNVGGLAQLWEGDTIEFIVDVATGTVLYVHVTGQAVTTHVEGQLFAISTEESTITIRDSGGSHFIYSMAEGIIITIGGTQYIMMDQVRHRLADMPYGQTLRLTLRNNVVIELAFVGHPVLVDEFRGFVVENNPAFGYMIVVDNTGNRIVMRYYSNEMAVERISHWDIAAPNYLSQLFPNFTWNPNATTIDRVVPGDIVFIRPDPNDAGVISMISAASNYIMRYGRVGGIARHDGYTSLTFEFENGQTTRFDIADGILITREGRRLNSNAIQIGDWARVLVNEAIIAPGHTISSVVEMTIEGGNRHISSIVRGNLSGINAIQNQIVIEHSQNFGQTGWLGFADISRFNIANTAIEFYHNYQRITREQALRLFGRSDATVYLALENHFAGEQVRKVVFRTDREERLPANTVIHTDGRGGFQLAGQMGTISTDAGTIVRRHGRLVTGMDIFPSDHVSVVLSGAGRAAIVDIFDRPDTSALQIMRARVGTVSEGQGFTVQSMSQLFGHEWVFSPIQREFTIDTRTVFLPAGDLTFETFRGFTEDSVIDRVFTVITDGARASHVIDQTFANRAARGTIYAIDVASGNIYLRDVSIQNPANNRWDVISITNNTMVINVGSDAVIGRNNAVVHLRDLQIGDQLLVMTDFIPAARTPGMSIDGRIVLVD